MSTTERLGKHAWWPTKFAAPTDKYVGTGTCATCHSEIADSQQQTGMAKTLARATDSSILAKYLGKPLKVDGFTYELSKTDQGPSYTLQMDDGSRSQAMAWAFGSGGISQVFLTPGDAFFNESHFSYFNGIDGFDVTPAQPILRNSNANRDSAEFVNKAVGRRVQKDEGRRCFLCHSANVPSSGSLNDVVPGVTCETCHGPGADHVAAIRAGLPAAGALIMNPARLRPVDQVDFCGSCHGTSVDVQLAGNMGLPTVRFPAYRLQNSACWSNDSRIQCTSCHDPHQPLSHEASSYDARCLSCHVSNANLKIDAQHPGRQCPVDNKNCSSCHMPKYEFPDVHHKFTDHHIRVVKEGEQPPP